MKGLRPFWRYYGGKWRAAPRYPAPKFDTIIEPFAGAAGYSLRYPERKVILHERYEVIAEVWRYLIRVSAGEVRRIPTVDSVDDLPSWVPQAARWLVGFCMNAGCTTPRRTMSAGLRDLRSRGRGIYGWSEAHRERVASQVDSIRHWCVVDGAYRALPDIRATWFIDPPYQGRPGEAYRHGSKHIDYEILADWCRTRRGQTIVCEAEGATWLPFSRLAAPVATAMNRRAPTAEAVWVNDEQEAA